MHQNDRINEFYENHEHTYRFDENILSTKQYKPQKVAKTGKKKQKMPKFTNSSILGPNLHFFNTKIVAATPPNHLGR